MTLRLLIFLLAAISISTAAAHEARPLSVTISEGPADRYTLSWQTPPSITPSNAPELTLGGPCTLDSKRRPAPLAGSDIYRCAGGLEGAELTIAYRQYNPSVSTLVRTQWRSGAQSTTLLGPETTVWRAPAPETFGGVSKSYFSLGVEHILKGYDHILFLLGLLYLARTPKRVLITVTGFTVSHSLTLALVALDILQVYVPAIEAVIALSIVFVAAEIARNDRTTLAWRRPVLVASTFGLLHGAGFAAVLGEIGLPQIEKVAALAFFNIGVEAGQLLLVAAAFATVQFLTRARTLAHGGVRTPFPEKAQGVFSYSLGVVSAYWFIERAAALFL